MLASTRMSLFWILLELRMMEVVLTTGAISRAKLQSNHHHQQTNTVFFTGRMPSYHPTNSVKALKGRISHSTDLLTPSSPGGLTTLSLTIYGSWLPWGGLPCLSSALWCQYPQNHSGICGPEIIKKNPIGKSYWENKKGTVFSPHSLRTLQRSFIHSFIHSFIQ